MSHYPPAPVDGSYNPSIYPASDPRHWPGLKINREAVKASDKAWRRDAKARRREAKAKAKARRREAKARREILEATAGGDGRASVSASLKKRIAAPALYILLLLTLWIWALVVTIIYWKEISLWAKIIAIIGLLFNVSIGTEVHYIFKIGSIVTLLVVYISRGLNK